MKTGNITPHGVSLEKHEMDTVVFFTERGQSVELIPHPILRITTAPIL